MSGHCESNTLPETTVLLLQSRIVVGRYVLMCFRFAFLALLFAGLEP